LQIEAQIEEDKLKTAQHRAKIKEEYSNQLQSQIAQKDATREEVRYERTQRVPYLDIGENRRAIRKIGKRTMVNVK
jgi:hypothetical protein